MNENEEEWGIVQKAAAWDIPPQTNTRTEIAICSILRELKTALNEHIKWHKRRCEGLDVSKIT